MMICRTRTRAVAVRGRGVTWRWSFDAGAFLAVERGDRDIVALVKSEISEPHRSADAAGRAPAGSRADPTTRRRAVRTLSSR